MSPTASTTASTAAPANAINKKKIINWSSSRQKPISPTSGRRRRSLVARRRMCGVGATAGGAAEAFLLRRQRELQLQRQQQQQRTITASNAAGGGTGSNLQQQQERFHLQPQRQQQGDGEVRRLKHLTTKLQPAKKKKQRPHDLNKSQPPLAGVHYSRDDDEEEDCDTTASISSAGTSNSLTVSRRTTTTTMPSAPPAPTTSPSSSDVLLAHKKKKRRKKMDKEEMHHRQQETRMMVEAAPPPGTTTSSTSSLTTSRSSSVVGVVERGIAEVVAGGQQHSASNCGDEKKKVREVRSSTEGIMKALPSSSSSALASLLEVRSTGGSATSTSAGVLLSSSSPQGCWATHHECSSSKKKMSKKKMMMERRQREEEKEAAAAAVAAASASSVRSVKDAAAAAASMASAITCSFASLVDHEARTTDQKKSAVASSEGHTADADVPSQAPPAFVADVSTSSGSSSAAAAPPSTSTSKNENSLPPRSDEGARDSSSAGKPVVVPSGGAAKTETTTTPSRSCEQESSAAAFSQMSSPACQLYLVTPGSRVSLWWDGEKEFYEATVTRVKSYGDKPYYLVYDDGDREWVDLEKETWKLISTNADAASSDDDVKTGEVAVKAFESSSAAGNREKSNEGATGAVVAGNMSSPGKSSSTTTTDVKGSGAAGDDVSSSFKIATTNGDCSTCAENVTNGSNGEGVSEADAETPSGKEPKKDDKLNRRAEAEDRIEDAATAAATNGDCDRSAAGCGNPATGKTTTGSSAASSGDCRDVDSGIIGQRTEAADATAARFGDATTTTIGCSDSLSHASNGGSNAMKQENADLSGEKKATKEKKKDKKRKLFAEDVEDRSEDFAADNFKGGDISSQTASGQKQHYREKEMGSISSSAAEFATSAKKKMKPKKKRRVILDDDEGEAAAAQPQGGGHVERKSLSEDLATVSGGADVTAATSVQDKVAKTKVQNGTMSSNSIKTKRDEKKSCVVPMDGKAKQALPSSTSLDEELAWTYVSAAERVKLLKAMKMSMAAMSSSKSGSTTSSTSNVNDNQATLKSKCSGASNETATGKKKRDGRVRTAEAVPSRDSGDFGGNSGQSQRKKASSVKSDVKKKVSRKGKDALKVAKNLKTPRTGDRKSSSLGSFGSGSSSSSSLSARFASSVNSEASGVAILQKSPKAARANPSSADFGCEGAGVENNLAQIKLQATEEEEKRLIHKRKRKEEKRRRSEEEKLRATKGASGDVDRVDRVAQRSSQTFPTAARSCGGPKSPPSLPTESRCGFVDSCKADDGSPERPLKVVSSSNRNTRGVTGFSVSPAAATVHASAFGDSSYAYPAATTAGTKMSMSGSAHEYYSGMGSKSMNDTSETSWVLDGCLPKDDSDSDTDDEEVYTWASMMLGAPQPSRVGSLASGAAAAAAAAAEDVRYALPELAEQRRKEKKKKRNKRKLKTIITQESAVTLESYATPPTTPKEIEPKRSAVFSKAKLMASSTPPMSPVLDDEDGEAYYDPVDEGEVDEELERETERRKKLEAKPLTQEEIDAILGPDVFDEDCNTAMANNWVRRSMRQPNRSALEQPKVRELLDKLRNNDPDMVVLKLKKYLPDPCTPQLVMDATLDALEENTNCQALYIQNFNEGMKDDQVLKLMQVLQRPTCNIWCLNIGETYKVRMSTWKKFTIGLRKTKISHMYASEHTITGELKEQIRRTIRDNRSKHNMHIDPNNLDVIIRCTHCWWNPVNAKCLRPYLTQAGYEKFMNDLEKQGLKGSKLKLGLNG